DDLFQQQRLIDRKIDNQRKELAPLESRFNMTYGGWAEYYVANYSDGVQDSRTFNRVGGAFWIRGKFEDAHEFFARVRLRYTSYGEGDQDPGEERYDLWGPNFDEAWYQI